MHRSVALFSSLSILNVVLGQQVGTNTAEVHPALSWQKCTTTGGCTTQAGQIVIDANWRWLHTTTGYTNCYTGNTWDASLCPDAVTCAANCALDGADYSGTYGITTSGNALTLKFITTSTQTNVGSRVYLMASDTEYEIFKPNNQEFTFDVDVSNLPCGLNGAVYFSEMSADGGLAAYPTNKAGAKYGTGYCDSQCPRDLKFIDGEANVVGWTPSTNDVNSGTGNMGSCCSEMDIWEANSMSAAYTPHPCSVTGQTMCTGDACGYPSRYSGVCDPDGCDFNSYRMGNTAFYGKGLTVDTSQKFTIVTQFITADGTASGALTEIRRLYVQNGKVIANSNVNLPNIDAVNSITDNYCTQQKTEFGDTNDFAAHGGLTTMGQSLARGGVLVLSIWDDHTANMLWLDSDYPTTGDPTKPGVARGTCATSSGVPSVVESTNASASVTYSNIKFGDIGSTYTGTVTTTTGSTTTTKSSTTGSATTTKSTTTSATTKSSATTTKSSTTTTKSTTTTTPTTTTKSSTTTTTTTTAGGATQTHWGQCAGIGYTGPTNCTPYTCTYSNNWYSQCL